MQEIHVPGRVVPLVARDDEHDGVALNRICDALRGLHFGTVTVVVQDGVVVQLERTEKLRLHRT